MKPKIKEPEEIVISFSDEQVKEQVGIVLNLGRRTIEDSFKLGEMLTYKKSEKAHGDWLPYLEEIGLSSDTANRLIKAFDKKDELIEGMTYSKLIGRSNSANGGISKEKQPDWFDQHTTEHIEAFALRSMVDTMKKVEKQFGLVYLNEFMDIVNRMFELGVTHINYKETWKQE